MADLKASLANTKPADGLAPPLAALWWAAKSDWDAAHKIVMNEDTKDAAWVHAYLHRSRAICPMPATGTARPVSPRRTMRSTPNGSGSSARSKGDKR